jgi:hypothetical protein
MPLSTYFAPRYFAVPFFRGLQPARASTASTATVTDRQVYKAMLAALRAARLFERVDFPIPAAPIPAPPGRPWAYLTPGDWKEHLDSRGHLAAREIEFTVTIVLSQTDPALAYERLDRLGSRVQELLEAIDLRGHLSAGRPTVARGAWAQEGRTGGIRLTLEGRVTYLLDRSLARSGASA